MIAIATAIESSHLPVRQVSGGRSGGVPRKFGDSARGSMDEGMTLLGRRNVGALLEDYNRIHPPERGIELVREH